jgi:hypothetical protein
MTGYPPPYFSLTWTWSTGDSPAFAPSSFEIMSTRSGVLVSASLPSYTTLRQEQGTLTTYTKGFPSIVHFRTRILPIYVLLCKRAVELPFAVRYVDVVQYRCLIHISIASRCQGGNNSLSQYLDVCLIQISFRFPG